MRGQRRNRPGEDSARSAGLRPRYIRGTVHEKVLIITGSTGIGAAVARMAAERGARVVLATADEISGFELAAETGAECWAGDLTLPHSAESVLAQCLSKFGRVD